MSVARIGAPELPNRCEAYSESSTNTFTAAVTAYPIMVSGLGHGRPYGYTVAATNIVGTSAALPVVVGVPKLPSAPGTPKISRIDAGGGELNLSISVSNKGGLAISNYSASCSMAPEYFQPAARFPLRPS
jgi:hypothetical protein